MLKNKLLYILEQNKGTIIKGGKLARALGVSRTAIWKAIHALQEDGNEILSIPNSGYQLLNTNDTLMEDLINENLTTSFIGQNIKLLPTVHSTNRYLKEMDTSNINNGFVVVADEQTSGRGRRDKTFVSAKQAGIYMSILLKVGVMQQDIRFLTICAAVAVSKAIEAICKTSADIKWVNDIFCNGKKICGILTEASLSAELQEADSVIIGIGINTGQVSEEIQHIATSVQEITGQRGIRNRLVAEVLNQFETIYIDYIKRGKKQDIISYYDSKLFIKGKRILVADTDNKYMAVVIGVDEMGALIVEDDEGKVNHLTTGEIIINPEETKDEQE